MKEEPPAFLRGSVSQLKTEARQVEQLYQLRNPEEIWRFLETHQHLILLLIEVHNHIRKYFPTADLILKYIVDPEVADEKQLAIYIVIDQNVDEAHDVLEQFDRDWWLDASDQVDGDLYINLEFV